MTHWRRIGKNLLLTLYNFKLNNTILYFLPGIYLKLIKKKIKRIRKKEHNIREISNFFKSQPVFSLLSRGEKMTLKKCYSDFLVCISEKITSQNSILLCLKPLYHTDDV